jgi:glycosyltransferase involved in cell wall biosynthesis
MRVLLVTDHKFLQFESKIYDVFRIDETFFADYHYVFDNVSVLSRLIDVDSLPEGARRSDGNGVDFIPGIHVAHRFFWVVTSKLFNIKLIKSEIASSDGVIVRVPSELGTHAAFEAFRQKKPLLAEVVGDPEESIGNLGRGGIHYKLLAAWEDYQMRRILKRATAASYVSRFSLQEKYPVSPGIHSDNISSLRLDEQDISTAREYLKVSDPFKIIYLANLIPHKRHIDLIEVCAKLKAQGMSLEVHFAGDGFIKEKLKLSARDLGVDDIVKFHGHISEKKDIFNLLDKSDLFIMPSASEGVPRAALEAMARGLPVLGSEAGAIPEIVRETEVFRVGDIDGLMQLIKDVYQNPVRLTEMSSYSIKTARQYTSKILSDKRKALYTYFKNLLKSPLE